MINIKYEENEYELNLLNEDFYNFYINHIDLNDNNILTKIINTTNTLNASFSNVKFDEKQLIELVECDDKIVMYSCNYGKKMYESYKEPVKIKTNNRGRKPKEVKKSTRKKQGNGTALSSQLTFNIINPDEKDKLYKIKVFRNGKVQLPGIKDKDINKVKSMLDLIKSVLDEKLNIDCKLDYITMTMSNYKFKIKKENHNLNLNILNTIFQDVKDNKLKDYDKFIPNIFMIKYNIDLIKLSIKFETNIIVNKKNKTILVNVFMSGKINIQGIYDLSTLINVYNLISYILENHPEIYIETTKKIKNDKKL